MAPRVELFDQPAQTLAMTWLLRNQGGTHMMNGVRILTDEALDDEPTVDAGTLMSRPVPMARVRGAIVAILRHDT